MMYLSRLNGSLTVKVCCCFFKNLAKRVAEIENKSFHYFKNNSFLNPVGYKIITQNK